MDEQLPLPEKAKEFFYYVGRAITVWAHVDEQLSKLFASIIKTERRQHAAMIYYSTKTIGGRLALTNDFVKTVLPERDKAKGEHPSEIEKKWKALYDDIGDTLPIRNRLAHSKAGLTAEHGSRDDGEIVITDVYWASYMSLTERLKTDMRVDPPPEVKTEDIKIHIASVEKLIDRLDAFRDELSKLPQ